MIADLVPRSSRLGRALPTAALAAVVALLAYAGHLASFVAPGAHDLFDHGVFVVLFLLAGGACLLRGAHVRAERSAWLVFGVSIPVSLVGWILYWEVVSGQDPQPFPSVSDGFWLAAYALNYCGLLLLMRSRVARLKTVLWLDAAIGVLALSAVSAGAVIAPVVDSTGGSTAAVVTNLVYPVGDLLVLAMVVSVFAVSGWRPDRSWLVIGAAFGMQAVVDAIYLYQSTAGTWHPGTLLDLGWVLNALLLGLAAWTRPRPVVAERGAEWLTMLMPAVFTLVAVAVLVYGTQTPDRFSIAATALATATLLAASVRSAITMRRMREISERHDRAVDAALTDHLTGLRNNRAFHEDLAREVDRVDAERPLALLMLDLVGLKATNDNLGHQAGDERLQTLARGLAAVLRRGDSAYRVGGDEFAVVLPGLSAWEGFALAERLQRTLSGGFTTLAPAVSVGLAEAGERMGQDALIRRASLALVEAKRTHRKAVVYSEGLERPLEAHSEGSRLHTKTLATALARAVDAKDSYTRSHCETVSELCVLIATGLGLDDARVEKLRVAGLLHDVGKIGIPDTILQKPGALTEDEFETIKGHSTLGHGVVSGAGLEEEAGWILHHHERPDGRGYPDGLSGDDVPLESRIILCADAFEAITSDRPYRAGRPEHEALAELRRNAGRQFDPDCVAALEAALRVPVVA